MSDRLISCSSQNLAPILCNIWISSSCLGMPICLSCGAIIVSDPKYCRSCKKIPRSQRTEAKFCKECGNLLDSETSLCPQCVHVKIPPRVKTDTPRSQKDEVDMMFKSYSEKEPFNTPNRSSSVKNWLSVIGIILIIGMTLISVGSFSIDIINIVGNVIVNTFTNELLPSIGLGKEPVVEIVDQTIYWTLYDSKGNEYNWSLPIDKSERRVGNIWSYNYLNLYNDVTGATYSVVDFRPFVGRSFSEVIDDVYHNSHGDADFVYEIEYIVSRLTTYSFEIGEQPRYAADTLVQGGGDCEDLTILIADMLRSSSYTKDWKIQIVYMDGNNPSRPLDMNHVILYVDDGTSSHLIESTAGRPGQNHYPDGVIGWFYNV